MSNAAGEGELEQGAELGGTVCDPGNSPSLPPGSALQLLAFPHGSWFATWKWTSSCYLISTDPYRTFSYEVEMVILYSSGAFFCN